MLLVYMDQRVPPPAIQKHYISHSMQPMLTLQAPHPGLTNHMAARQRQSQLLVDHLMAQYRDRQAYWEMRGSSRLGCSSTVCCILDGMDQCKFLYPRSPLCLSKDLAGMPKAEAPRDRRNNPWMGPCLHIEPSRSS